MRILVPALIVLVTGLGLAYATAEDPKPGAPGAPVADAQHTMLQRFVGKWDAVLVSHDPTGKETRTKGTMTTVKHTNFFTVDSFDGDFMGQPFIGHGVNGYCPLRKKFFTFWTDSMTPTPVYLTGDYDATKHEMSMKGECSGMSGKLEPCRTVTRYENENHYSWAFYGTGPDGKEMQFISIEYTRKK